MPGRKTNFGCPKVAAVIDELHAKEPEGWRKNRLLAVKLATKGEHTSSEIAGLCGVARTYIFAWFQIAREGGLDALLQQRKRGPKEGTCRGIAPKVRAEFEKKLHANKFASAAEAHRWLEQKDGVKRAYNTVWIWIKKARKSAEDAQGALK